MGNFYNECLNISCIAGKSGSPIISYYLASEARLVNFTQAPARELAPHRINVNVTPPGLLWTPMWAKRAGGIGEENSSNEGNGII